MKWSKEKDNNKKQGIVLNFKESQSSNKDLTKEIVFKNNKSKENKKKNKSFTWD